MEQNIQFEVNTELLLLFLVITKNESCSESLEQICLDGVEKGNKNTVLKSVYVCYPSF